MAVKLEAFAARAQKALYRKLLKAGVVVQRHLKRKLGASNRKGNQPSKPGEAPRRSQYGWLQANVIVAGDGKSVVRVGIGKAAWYGAVLENGTGPRRIVARGNKKLMIPIRRNLGAAEAKRLGAIRIVDHRDGVTKWVIFRREVNHPGIAPRPWLAPGFREVQPTIRRVIGGN